MVGRSRSKKVIGYLIADNTQKITGNNNNKNTSLTGMKISLGVSPKYN